MKLIYLAHTEYKQGLASFLDENGINWTRTDDGIAFPIENVKQAFLIGFAFGEFYKNEDNY